MITRELSEGERQAGGAATAQKIADWLGVPWSTLLDTGGTSEDKATLAAKIAAVLKTEPRLARVFGRAMDRVQIIENGRPVDAY